MNRRDTAVEKLLTAMAYNRNDFKDKVEEKLGGALMEHYKAVLATRNHQTRWVRHWQTEVNRLIRTDLVVVLLHAIKGFKDCRKAAADVVQHLRAVDDQYRRAAAHTVRHDYGLDAPRAPITDEDMEDFHRRVQTVIDTSTEPRRGPRS